MECNGVENPNGEQHYRGPHGLSASDCTGVSVCGITIHDAGNYALYCKNDADMHSAFSHFSPPDRNPKRHSDNWLVEDCIMDRVESLYAYNYVAGTSANGTAPS